MHVVGTSVELWGLKFLRPTLWKIVQDKNTILQEPPETPLRGPLECKGTGHRNNTPEGQSTKLQGPLESFLCPEKKTYPKRKITHFQNWISSKVCNRRHQHIKAMLELLQIFLQGFCSPKLTTPHKLETSAINSLEWHIDNHNAIGRLPYLQCGHLSLTQPFPNVCVLLFLDGIRGPSMAVSLAVFVGCSSIVDTQQQVQILPTFLFFNPFTNVCTHLYSFFLHIQ